MRRRTNRRPTARLRLLTLEGREVPAVVNWTLGANGDFANPAAWTDASNGSHRVPGPNDDAVIPAAFMVTSSASQTVDSLSATNFRIASGTFTINATDTASNLPGLVVATGATLALAGGNQQIVIDSPGLNEANALSLTGNYVLGTGSTLRLRRNFFAIDPGFSVTGSGQFLLQGDSLASASVKLNTPLTAPANLALVNTVLFGTSTLTIPNGVTTNCVTTQFSGSTVSCPVVVQSGGTLVIGGQASVLLGGILTNDGSVVYNPTAGDGLRLLNGGRIDNQAGATFRIESDILISGSISGLPAINNAGTIVKQVTTGTTTLGDLTVNNTGVVTVLTGVLKISEGGGTHTGAFNIADGAGLTFFNGPNIPVLLNAGATVSGPGTLTIDGTNLATQVNPGATIASNVQLRLALGDLQLNTPVTVASYSQSNGNLTGAATLTVTGTGSWTGGVMSGGGTTVVPAGATFTLSGTGATRLRLRTLQVGGTVNHTGTTLTLEVVGGPATTIAIQPSGTYNWAVDTPFNGSNGTIDIQGLFVKTSPTGTGTSSVNNHAFNNSGTVRVDSGTLALNCNTNPSTDTGAYVVANGAGLTFTAGTRTVNAPASFSGTGLVLLSNGTLVVNTPVSLANFAQIGGTLSGTGAVTLTGPASWTGGIMTGGGTTVVPAGVTLTLAGTASKDLAQRAVNVAGTVNQTAGALSLTSNTVLTIQPTGTYNLAVDANLNGVSGTINNQGLFVKTSPTGTGTTSGNHTFNNSGILRVDSGTLLFQNLPFTQTAGQTTVSASATLQRAGGVQINGGTLGGTGTVLGNVAGAGSVSPGFSPGLLTIAGNANLAGPFVAELNSPSAGNGYDQLQVNGTVTLGGPLNLSVGFAATAGLQFTIIANDGADAITGTFAGLPQGASLTANGQSFTVSYVGGTGNDVVLTRTAGPTAPPRVTGVTVNEGQANAMQRSRVTSLTVRFDSLVTFAGGDVAAAFGLSRIDGGAVGGFSATAAPVNGVTVVTLTNFTGAETNFGSLADGRYAILVRANLVAAGALQLDGDGNGTGGDDYTLNGTVANGLYRLFGDVDGSGIVNAADFGQFRSAFGSSLGQTAYRDFLDFDGDGSVNAFDFGQFRPRFGAGPP